MSDSEKSSSSNEVSSGLIDSSETEIEVKEDLEIAQKEALKYYSGQDSKRYECFRRSNFSKNEIRKFVAKAIDQVCNQNFQIVVSSVGKIFVGEIVEMMIEIRNEENIKKEEKGIALSDSDMNELKPSHAHEAFRRLYKKIPNLRSSKKKYNF